MNNQDIKNAPKLAWNNHNLLKDNCGCYHCLEIINVQDIKEWTDYGKTAICPKCNCDCLIPEIDLNNLKKIQDYWIKKPN